MKTVIINILNNATMKKIWIIAFIGLTIIAQAYGQSNTTEQANEKPGIIYENTVYRFKATIPGSWRLHGHVINDTRYNMAIADWGLPKVYSEVEKTEIENSISIVAYRRKEINSVDRLIQFEYERYKGNSPTSKIILEEDKTNRNARILNITRSTGIQFKGKWYIYFQNDIGYVIAFMATPGTYEKNLKVFEEFHENVELY